ncbi:MAG: hypothetical protein C4K48_06520 [Candidatus Thorarchaeota archaeon]|nr:MAG: hypothetical protein C4K48_06520 [Candidatus Thorarchaeota archaeon]
MGYNCNDRNYDVLPICQLRRGEDNAIMEEWWAGADLHTSLLKSAEPPHSVILITIRLQNAVYGPVV